MIQSAQGLGLQTALSGPEEGRLHRFSNRAPPG
jgi:hypothetical protein